MAPIRDITIVIIDEPTSRRHAVLTARAVAAPIIVAETVYRGLEIEHLTRSQYSRRAGTNRPTIVIAPESSHIRQGTTSLYGDPNLHLSQSSTLVIGVENLKPVRETSGRVDADTRLAIESGDATAESIELVRRAVAAFLDSQFPPAGYNEIRFQEYVRVVEALIGRIERELSVNQALLEELHQRDVEIDFLRGELANLNRRVTEATRKNSRTLLKWVGGSPGSLLIAVSAGAAEGASSASVGARLTPERSDVSITAEFDPARPAPELQILLSECMVLLAMEP